MSAKVIENGIFLTFDEIRILFFGMGVSEVEGVYMPEKIFCEEDVIRAMHHLSEIGFIEAGEGRFVIREDIRYLLEVMAKPEQTNIWKPKEEEKRAFFFYKKEKQIVVSEKSRGKKETLKLTVFEEEAFEKWREEMLDDHSGDRGAGYGNKI